MRTDGLGRPLVPGVNVDPVDVAAGGALAAELGYGDPRSQMVIEYALMRWRRGEEAGAEATVRSHGVGYTSWRVCLAAAVAAARGGAVKIADGSRLRAVSRQKISRAWGEPFGHSAIVSGPLHNGFRYSSPHHFFPRFRRSGPRGGDSRAGAVLRFARFPHPLSDLGWRGAFVQARGVRGGFFVVCGDGSSTVYTEVWTGAWRGGRGGARPGLARRDKAGRGMARRGWAGHGEARLGGAWRGVAGAAGQGEARHGRARPGKAWRGSAWQAWPGSGGVR